MRFEQVAFRYGRRAGWTLHAVQQSVEPGQTIVVLGHNGAGKSTLLQLAAGVRRPTRGVIRDRPAVVGWVPERFPADQPFTAGGYLHRMAEVRGQTDPAVVDRWIERLLLAEHAGTRLADLSKGTAQKVGLAQALLVRPGLLVLDEPWEGLDAAARTLIPAIVGEVTQAGGSVLVSDHRGEITNLPGAQHWTVTDRTVPTEPEERPEEVPGGPPGEASGTQPGAALGARLAGAPGPRSGAASDEVIVQVAVRRADADQAVVRLRAAGHRVLGIRDWGPDPRFDADPDRTGGEGGR